MFELRDKMLSCKGAVNVSAEKYVILEMLYFSNLKSYTLQTLSAQRQKVKLWSLINKISKMNL